ncbi:Phosphatidylglycerol/phosphatidylinositol transfer protein, partial [Quaeritorhiza haematococci]
VREVTPSPAATSLPKDSSRIPVNRGFQAPFNLCGGNEPSVLALDTIAMSPNPPRPGDNVTIFASGQLLEPIVWGATLETDVKFGLVTVRSETVDLCSADSAKAFSRALGIQPEATVKCPVAYGYVQMNMTMPVPSNIPRVMYNFRVASELFPLVYRVATVFVGWYKVNVA